jgi:hypothetical protein
MYKQCIHNKIILWVSFILHKYPKNHYRFFLFQIFFELQINLKGDHDLWKYLYTNKKDDIEKT